MPVVRTEMSSAERVYSPKQIVKQDRCSRGSPEW